MRYILNILCIFVCYVYAFLLNFPTIKCSYDDRKQ